MMKGLKNKFVLVTGATTGIGNATAIRFAQEGCSVCINFRTNPEAAKTTLAAAQKASADNGHAGAKHITVYGDVSKEDDVKKMFADTLAAFGRLDVLINNAGWQKESPSDQLDMADYDGVMNTNIRGAFMCAREALKHFLARGGGGVILSNSSVHQIIPKPGFASYSLSKGAMGNMTRTLALEYANRGIRVNAVGPGAIITPINKAWKDDPKARAGVESHIPMGRSGESEEIASVFAFLASDEASYITGQTIYACGGLTLYPEFRINWSS
jgi:glucose 1-dehydrogenase